MNDLEGLLQKARADVGDLIQVLLSGVRTDDAELQRGA